MRPDLIPNIYHYLELQTQERTESSLPGGSWEGVNPYPGALTTMYGTVRFIDTPIQELRSLVYWGRQSNDNL